MPEKKDYIALFDEMFPNYFSWDSVRSIPEKYVYDEMILDLKSFDPDAAKIEVPEGITFGFFKGDMNELRRSVAEVDDGWVRYYNNPDASFCAFDGSRVVSFCDVDEMGTFHFMNRTVKVGGPGCVGTIPSYRRKGIGLRMVQLATGILKDRGFDYSFIHYTGVGRWYARLGYETVLRWNGRGFVD